MRKRPKAHADQTDALVTIAAGISEVARAHFVLGTSDRDPFLLVARDILAGNLDVISTTGENASWPWSGGAGRISRFGSKLLAQPAGLRRLLLH